MSTNQGTPSTDSGKIIVAAVHHPLAYPKTHAQIAIAIGFGDEQWYHLVWVSGSKRPNILDYIIPGKRKAQFQLVEILSARELDEQGREPLIIEFDVTEEQATKALAKAQLMASEEPKSYSLITNDCVSTVKLILKAAGIQVPVLVILPKQLYRWLEERQS